MSEPIDRLQLLRGDLFGNRVSVRPPWSQPEAIFIETCVRCDECILNCSAGIIRFGVGGFPKVDFSSRGCTFCGDCVRACQTNALSFCSDPTHPPWFLSVEVGDNCLAMRGVVCRSCSERCEESAIRFRLQTGGRATPELDAGLCSGCGECISVCPTQSIKIRPAGSDRAA